MDKEKAIRFAGLMESYLNIPSFVCEMIEKDLCNDKYKETIEYVINRRNEIENKKDYISEQQLINKYIDLQQRIDKAVEWCECVVNAKYTSDKLPNGQTTDMGYCLDLAEPLLKILKGDDTNE